ncbi:hypothetical protein [Rhodopirellula europaea]|uniref:hypothetical protein n=1 Tax=Rhodopirellula europaea TaxID=1263866 RepID=UPI003D2780D6|tara:strand:- start:356 stop:517 length:162 start_codon:yes stop_codon:yes gene_type:complete
MMQIQTGSMVMLAELLNSLISVGGTQALDGLHLEGVLCMQLCLRLWSTSNGIH